MNDEIVRTVVCKIKKVIFTKGLFRILLCKITKHENKKQIGREFICKGTIQFNVFIDDEIEITGNPVKAYNKFKDREEFQIVIKSAKKTDEAKAIQAERILTKVKGIGPVKARQIIDSIGKKDILKTLCNNSSVLSSFDLTPEQAIQIRNLANKFTKDDTVTAELLKLKITDYQIGKIKEYFKGNISIEHIKKHLFELIDVAGFGFVTVCRIADAFGIPKSDEGRVEAGILHALKTLTSNGDCYVEHQDLINESHKILEISTKGSVVKDVLRRMVKQCELYHKDTEVFGESNVLPNPKPKIKERYSENCSYRS